ncbi:discoidin domain-containing protein [Paenibacillus sp. 2RAB27]|uniref:discoidin domain-containing protein n=1 Tax=Paenibacillus sp. 2RAB27 TaxID=3232991 RepID=UPI003F946890
MTASPVSGSQIDLNWTASTDNIGVTGYDVYRGAALVGTSTTTSYSDTGLSASTAYSYTIKAKDAAGNASAASNTASATTSSLSGNLAFGKTYSASTTWSASYLGDKAFDGDIATRWSASSGSFNNQWISVDFGSPATYNQVVIKEISFPRVTAYKLQSSTDGTTYTDIAGTTGTTIGANKTISFSSVSSRYLRLYITTASNIPNIDEMEVYGPSGSDTTAPTAPTNVTASATSSSQINLSWTASTDNVGVTGYEVYRGAALVGSSATTSYSDTGLSASTAYSYTVKAKDSAGNVSAASNTGSATTLAAGGNLALGKTYGASTIWNASYSAANAFDGDISNTSRWSASSGSLNNQWISVDFGVATTYKQVVMKEVTFQRVTSYKLQFSNDGTTYSDISGTTGTTIGANQTVNFSPITSRYLRLYISAASAVPTINEIEVYNQ